MSTNGNDRAFCRLSEDPWNKPILVGGLTKREYFAAMALSGFTSQPYKPGRFNSAATDAVILADALIEALNKEQL